MTRLPEGTIKQVIRPQKQVLKQNNLRPGAMISSDQFVSKLGGRLYSSAGKEQEKDNTWVELFLLMMLLV